MASASTTQLQSPVCPPFEDRRYIDWLEQHRAFPVERILFVQNGDSSFQSFAEDAERAARALPGLMLEYVDIFGRRVARMSLNSRLLDRIVEGLLEAGWGVAVAAQVDGAGHMAIVRNIAPPESSRRDHGLQTQDAAAEMLPTPIRRVVRSLISFDRSDQRTICGTIMAWLTKLRNNGAWQGRDEGWPVAWRNQPPTPAMINQAMNLMASLPQRHHRSVVKLLRRIRQTITQIPQTARTPFDESADTALALECVESRSAGESPAQEIMGLLAKMSPDIQQRVARMVNRFYQLLPEPRKER